MNEDPEGTFWRELIDSFNTIIGYFDINSTLTAIGAIVIAGFNGRWEDILHDFVNGCINPLNRNEEVAMRSKVLSFYNGSTVFRLKDSDVAFSFAGTIWLGTVNMSVDDLKHEYGHSIQERILGLFYISNIAIPSMKYNKTVHSSYDYYSTPWERTADLLGGVDRGNYKDGSIAWGILENIFGPKIIPFYFIWGY